MLRNIFISGCVGIGPGLIAILAIATKIDPVRTMDDLGTVALVADLIERAKRHQIGLWSLDPGPDTNKKIKAEVTDAQKRKRLLKSGLATYLGSLVLLARRSVSAAHNGVYVNSASPRPMAPSAQSHAVPRCPLLGT